MIGILGSGFGAYVYAPSLFFQSNQQILVTKKTYSFIKSRSDISFLLHRLLPFESERDLIKSSSSLILARRPFDSLPLVNNFTNSNFDHIYFEKPFADTPDNALLLHSLLLSKYINYSVNYILCFLDPPLIKNHTSSDTLSFVWNFMAHHYSNNLYNWKREHISGGGALRFYGVHFIALAYSLGYYYPISSSSTLDYSYWDAIFENTQNKKFHISINSKSSSTEFRTVYNNIEITKSKTLFDSQPKT